MRAIRFALLAFTTIGASCGAATPAVKPGDMSVTDHRAEAAREDEAARRHEASYDPGATRPVPLRPVASGPDGEYLFSTSIYNPTEANLQEADRHRAHARQHEKAAQALEKFEAQECRGFPPATRAACPLLGPVIKIDDIPGGVRATLVQGTRVDAVVAHMRCHYAYALARGFDDSVTCPLYMRGIEIKQGRDGASVEITTKDAARVDELRGRSREEAMYARGGGR